MNSIALRCLLAATCLFLSMPVSSVLALDEGDAFRLGVDVVPIHQAVELKLDPEAYDYAGVTVISLSVVSEVTSFRLHSQGHDLGEVALKGPAGAIAVTYETGEGDLLKITPSVAMAPGSYELRISFSAEYQTDAEGLYRVVSDGTGYLFTQFEATDARAAFPCFDEPRFKLPFDMLVRAPVGNMVVANTPVVDEQETDGWVSVKFATSKPLPSYLVALAVGPLEAVPIPGMSVPGNVITTKGQSHLAAAAVASTPPLLEALEEYFGRPYPYAKLDLIAVPEFWPGAMENAGAITYRDGILLVDEDAASLSQLRNLAQVTAHELAHQWFGNLVTMEWWDDLWLNESFATWIGVKMTDQVFPEYAMDITNVSGTMRAMSTDSRVKTRAIRQPVHALDNMLQSADALAYQKGAAVLGMFEEFVGEEKFRDGVLRYVENNAWKNATADDLWAGLSEATGIAIGDAMSTFVDQAGVPTVDVSVLGDGKIEFRQRRFLKYGAKIDGPAQQWHLPVVYRYSDGKQQRTERVMLQGESTIVELPGGVTPHWVHPNADEKGYYHWSVAPDMLMTMIDAGAEALTLRERMALVGHTAALLDAGAIGGGDFLRAMGKLASDQRPEVISSLLGALGKVRFAFITNDQRDNFASYVRNMLAPAVDRFGLSARDGESEAVKLLRPALITWVGVHGADASVRRYAREVADKYLDDPTSVDAQVASSCLRVAAVEGDWALYNRYRKSFEAATVPADRSRYLGALGYFGKESMAKASLRYALEGPTRPQEMFSVIQGIPTVMGETSMLYEWMTQNYGAIREKIPEMMAIYMPYFATSCSRERLAAAEIFFADPEHSVVGQDKELAKVGEDIQDCAGLRDREGETVAAFLAQFGGSR